MEKIIRILILSFFFLIYTNDVYAFCCNCNSNITMYCDKDPAGATNGTVKLTEKDNKLYIEYYNFETPCGNNGHAKEVYLNTGGIKSEYYSNVATAPRQDYCAAKGTQKEAKEHGWDKTTWFFDWDNNKAYLKGLGLVKNNFRVMTEGNHGEHYHYVRIEVTAAQANNRYNGMKYITIGSGNNVLAYKALGCSINRQCAVYNNDSPCGCNVEFNCKEYNNDSPCGCNVEFNCKTYYSAADGISSQTCNNISDTRKSDDTKRIYSLSGTNVETGTGINATCDSNGNCQF